MAKRKGKGKVVKWFKKGEPTGWQKGDTQTQRRRVALASHKGKLLPTARSLMALSNVTQDKETARLARADAQYFYALYKAKQKRERREKR